MTNADVVRNHNILFNKITGGQLKSEKQDRPEDLVIDLRVAMNCRKKWKHFEPKLALQYTKGAQMFTLLPVCCKCCYL